MHQNNLLNTFKSTDFLAFRFVHFSSSQGGLRTDPSSCEQPSKCVKACFQGRTRCKLFQNQILKARGHRDPYKRTCIFKHCLTMKHADVETLQLSRTFSPYRLRVNVYCTGIVIARCYNMSVLCGPMRLTVCKSRSTVMTFLWPQRTSREMDVKMHTMCPKMHIENGCCFLGFPN